MLHAPSPTSGSTLPSAPTFKVALYLSFTLLFFRPCWSVVIWEFDCESCSQHHQVLFVDISFVTISYIWGMPNRVWYTNLNKLPSWMLIELAQLDEIGALMECLYMLSSAFCIKHDCSLVIWSITSREMNKTLQKGGAFSCLLNEHWFSFL